MKDAFDGLICRLEAAEEIRAVSTETCKMENQEKKDLKKLNRILSHWDNYKR
jgi:hypothetical protein